MASHRYQARRYFALWAALAALGTLPALADLSHTDLARQITYSALHVADWNQTRRIAASNGRWIELNPILGPSPSQSRVNRYFAATLVAHWAITYTLPERWRKPWQETTIILQASVIQSNYRLGISASF